MSLKLFGHLLREVDDATTSFPDSLPGGSCPHSTGRGIHNYREKQNEAEKKRTALNLELTALNERISTLTRAAPTPGTKPYAELQQKSFRLNQVNAELASLPARRTTPVSKGIFRDLISDGDGVSFHRFQIVVWTAVLAVVFIRSVSRDLAMPDFDAALLGLMGISSGTYLGFKFPEKPK